MNFIECVTANTNEKGTIDVLKISKIMGMSIEQVHTELLNNDYDLSHSNVQAKDGNIGLIWTYGMMETK